MGGNEEGRVQNLEHGVHGLFWRQSFFSSSAANINPNRKQKHLRRNGRKFLGTKRERSWIEPEKESESHRKFAKENSESEMMTKSRGSKQMNQMRVI